MAKFLVSELIEQFSDCVTLLDGKKNINNPIAVPGLKRVVFEMLGLFSSRLESVAILGKREFMFLSQKTEHEQCLILQNILKLNPPAIILTKSFSDHQQLLKANKNYQVPILSTKLFSTELSFTVEAYINEQFATVEKVHAVLLEIFGVGVLLMGRSGIGKSESALELINKNHLFIADDAVEIYRLGNRLFGRAQEICRKFMEIRGLGIINVERAYGLQKLKPHTEIQLCINLLNLEEQTTVSFERLGASVKHKQMLGVNLNYYEIPISPGRKTSEIIESAVIDFKLKNSGYNSALDFIEKQHDILKRRNDE